MNSKRFWALTLGLLLLFSLSACASAPKAAETPEPSETPEITATPEPTSEPTATPEPTPETSPSHIVTEVTFERFYDGGDEYATMTAVNASGDTVWSLTTDRFEAAQLDFTHDIGIAGDMYVFIDKNGVNALDLDTGAPLWTNKEFNGAPVEDAIVIDEKNERIFLSGYFGPDLFICNFAGQTLGLVDMVAPEYFWPVALELVDDGHVSITYEADDNGDGNPHTVIVNLSDYSYALKN